MWKNRLPMGIQVLFGLGSLLALLGGCMLIAIFVVADVTDRESRLNYQDVPYASAVAKAALNAKGVANDQRGYLLTGDRDVRG